MRRVWLACCLCVGCYIEQPGWQAQTLPQTNDANRPSPPAPGTATVVSGDAGSGPDAAGVVSLVSIASVRVRTARSDGRSWDESGGSAPDIFVSLVRNGIEVLRTETVVDSFEPSFDPGHGRSIRLAATERLEIEVFDDDPGQAELIARFGIPPPGPEHVSRGIWEIGPAEPMELVTIRLAPPRSLIGTGIRWQLERGALDVLEIAAGSPAERSGVQTGDRIVQVDGQTLGRASVQTVERLLEGALGSRVRLEIERGRRRFDLELERAIVYY